MDRLQDLAVSSADALIEASDVVVVSHATSEFRAALARRAPHVAVLDLVRLHKELPENDPTYQGIAW
jgi:hypothetical protein